MPAASPDTSNKKVAFIGSNNNKCGSIKRKSVDLYLELSCLEVPLLNTDGEEERVCLAGFICMYF